MSTIRFKIQQIFFVNFFERQGNYYAIKSRKLEIIKDLESEKTQALFKNRYHRRHLYFSLKLLSKLKDALRR